MNDNDNNDFIVVWSGTMSRKGKGLVLVPPRDTKPGDTWEPPTRAYNKTGKHTKKSKQEPQDVNKDNG